MDIKTIATVVCKYPRTCANCGVTRRRITTVAVRRSVGDWEFRDICGTCANETRRAGRFVNGLTGASA